MAPLRIESYRGDISQWVQVGEVNPGDRPGSISQNTPDGTRELYLFECAPDNSQSIIYRSKFGADVDGGKLRVVISDRANLEIMRVLKEGEKPYTLTLKTDVSPQRTIIRFSHHR